MAVAASRSAAIRCWILLPMFAPLLVKLSSQPYLYTARALSSTGRIVSSRRWCPPRRPRLAPAFALAEDVLSPPSRSRRRQRLQLQPQMLAPRQRRQLSVLSAETSIGGDGGGGGGGAASGGDDDDATAATVQLSMENLYREWSLDDDKLLWEGHHMRKRSTAELASTLGRGLRGVESRLAKLKDVDSPAYERLFVAGAGGAGGGGQGKQSSSSSQGKKSKARSEKLVPVSEVLRRIEWDDSLPSENFSVLHYDRVDDKVVESPYTAPNDSIKGPQTRFVDALPEHRIVAVKYLERVVWDRNEREDRFFGNEGIVNVIETYDEWKRKRDEAVEWNRQRQKEVAEGIRQVLGFARFGAFQELSADLLSKSKDPSAPLGDDVERFVAESTRIFREAREDTSQVLAPVLIPKSDYEALDAVSELVALLPDVRLRQLILTELSIAMRRAEGKKGAAKTTSSKNPAARELPQLNEDDVTETFVRGSGPGGQKINKTSNRVVLVHEPTQVRVECQDTRSLQQNRKIARKRLRLKLDEHYNGSQSRESLKAQRASSKKAKAKARSRARQRKKKAKAKEGDDDDEEEGRRDDRLVEDVDEKP